MDFLVKVSEVIYILLHIIIVYFIGNIYFCISLQIDINECSEGSHNCTSTQDCRNIVGGFECPCKIGYEASVNGSTCVGMYLYTPDVHM